MIGLSIISWIGPLVMAGLLYALYRKAGLRGGVLLAAFLPVLGLVLSTMMNVVLGGAAYGDPMNFLAVSSLMLVALHLAPLIVLLVVDWPMGTQDDVFK